MLNKIQLTNQFPETCMLNTGPVSVNNRLNNAENLIMSHVQLVKFVESVTQMVLILNDAQQIVYASESYSNFFGPLNVAPEVIGHRPGEAFNCQNAFQPEGGCGHTIMCRNCGAANAIIESQKGNRSTRECKILTMENDTIDLRVTASPLTIEDEKFTIFSITDISHEKQRESLERIFIHDILNSAGGISGLSAILKEVENPDEIRDIADTIQRAANNLIEEIQTQREIGSAERGDLVPQLNEVDSLSILKELKKIYNNHELNFGKPIFIHPESVSQTFITDKVLLKRILGNMIKNAIESPCPNDRITLNCKPRGGRIRFIVQNLSVIPDPVQSELFKRFYSTKEHGRGIGTYSMKLFGEKYLGGKVGFRSMPEMGTSFYFEI